MSQSYPCWQCGKPLQNLILPMSRREECSYCGADQHTCKMCIHYTARGCDEERAESVSDPEKANFCDYFSPSYSAFGGHYQDKSAKAKAELAALFDDEPSHQVEAPNDQAEASRDQDKSAQALTPAEIAEQKLAQMLNDKF